MCEVDNCIHCGICKEHCLFLKKYDIDLYEFSNQPKLAYSCFMCGICKKVCPKNIDGVQIAQNMRKNSNLDTSKYKGLLWEKNPYKFANYTKINSKKNISKTDRLVKNKKSVLFPGCNFSAFFPKTLKKLEDICFQNEIGVVYDCCSKPIFELGLQEDAQKNIDSMISKLKKNNVEELIMICPNCYYFLKDKIDISVISIYEKLYELNETEKYELNEVRKVKGTKNKSMDEIAFYIPCPDREERVFINDISKFIEKTIVYPYEKTQCCGLGGCALANEPEIATKMAKSVNIKKESVEDIEIDKLHNV
ncbi:MAG: (Fe-S)-binding protein, partial [Clostridioides sp.]|nr:(Fe-S)-binding protein [Clostridioides sp.]